MDIDTPNYMTVDTLETLLGPEDIIDAPPGDATLILFNIHT
jgi:hypothetical protein